MGQKDLVKLCLKRVIVAIAAVVVTGISGVCIIRFAVCFACNFVYLWLDVASAPA